MFFLFHIASMIGINIILKLKTVDALVFFVCLLVYVATANKLMRD